MNLDRFKLFVNQACDAAERRALAVTGNLYNGWLARVHEETRILDEQAASGLSPDEYLDRLRNLDGESRETVWEDDRDEV